MKHILHAALYLFALVIHCHGQSKQDLSFYKMVKNYDLSVVFNPDSITDDGNQKYKRPEPIGYIDPDYQRFQIHIASISKSNSDPYVYHITGKTKVKDNVCDFKGTITVGAAAYDTSSLMRDIGFPQYKQGVITGRIHIEEDKTQPGSGIIKGDISTEIYFDLKNQIHYSALMLVADGFCNNQVEARWTSYKTGKTKKCNWGDFRIPNSRALDVGTGEFAVNEKYKQNGWMDYSYKNNDVEWWLEK